MTPLEITQFKDLIAQIHTINSELKQQATKSINIALTIRNWLIGYYIAEYELKGSDRAEYGDKLYDRLAEELSKIKIPRSDKRELYRYYKFYKVYPQIVDSLSPQLLSHMNKAVSDTLCLVQTNQVESEVQIVDSVSPLSGITPSQLIIKLSFTHIRLLLDIDDSTKRSFYELECIRGNWSIRELQRQINSHYYERSGLSKNKKKLSEQTHKGAEQYNPITAVRDPYVFEFLGLKPQEVMSESHLEDQLISKLQDFLLELGHGFCFESRQQRILIGDTQYYVDLVFYHRILKCHVLVELKLSEFNHENIGQLNTYVSWYKQNEMLPGDNPPIGILLCSSKDSILVEYALAGMDNQLFVSKYQLELPKQEEMKEFVKELILESGIKDN